MKKNKPLRIAIDVSQMCYEGTGVARYVRGLTEALLSARTPHRFVCYAGALRQRAFFTRLAHTSPWNRATWKIFPLPPKLAGFLLNTLPLPLEWLIGRVDLVHTSDWSEPSSHLPKVSTVHDLVFKKYPETLDPLIERTQAKRLSRIVEGDTHILADSVNTKNDLMEIYHLPSERITVIYPGLDKPYVPQSKKEIDRVKKEYHLPDQYLLSLGTQEPRKNIARVIEAAEGLGLPLVLTGKYGWGKKIGGGTNVVSTGYVKEADLPALYSGAHVFVYPSLYEGFGFPVLEAMACGAPVVTASSSSLPEVGGSAAVLVDPLDSESIKQGIRQAIAERAERIIAGRMQAQKFTWEKAAKEILEVYEKIANRS